MVDLGAPGHSSAPKKEVVEVVVGDVDTGDVVVAVVVGESYKSGFRDQLEVVSSF